MQYNLYRKSANYTDNLIRQVVKPVMMASFKI